MKILFVVNVLSGGGGERVVQTLANYLCRRERCQVTVVTLEASDNSYSLDERVKRRTLRSARFSRGLGKVLCIPVQAYELGRILREERPDASVAFLVRSNLVHILSRRFWDEGAIFISEHSPIEKQYERGGPRDCLMRWLVRRLYPQADGAFAVSDGIRRSLLSSGISPSKIKVVYNPQPLDVLRAMALEPVPVCLRQGPHRLVTMGRLIDLKDHDTLFKAFARVRASTDVSLYIIGDGPNRGKLAGLAQVLGVSDAITFLGWQANPFPILRQADLFVLSSRFEGFGNVIVEAMACGVPVVSTDCPSGPREILKDGQVGLLVPVGDVGALAQAITALLREPQTRAEYAKRGEERAKDFDVAVVADEYLDFMRLLQCTIM